MKILAKKIHQIAPKHPGNGQFFNNAPAVRRGDMDLGSCQLEGAHFDQFRTSAISAANSNNRGPSFCPNGDVPVDSEY